MTLTNPLKVLCFMIGADIDMIEPSLHEIQSKASISAWQQLREGMLTITTENSAMPVGQKCLSCDDQAFFRFVKCGPFSFYCFECFCRQHRTSNSDRGTIAVAEDGVLSGCGRLVHVVCRGRKSYSRQMKANQWRIQG